jgi:hypothetical protein
MQLYGETSENQTGFTLGYAGDINEDGFEDLFIGSPYEDSGGSNAGAAYLYHGSSSLPSTVNLSSADAKFVAEYDYDYASWGMASGDMDGDDQRDLLISAHESDEGGNNSGVIYIFTSTLTGTVDMGTADATVVGERSDTMAGTEISVADIDNDDQDDLVIGAYGVSSYAGAVYIVYGPLSGLIDLASADAEIRGNGNYDYLGWSVDAGGDVNGDGVSDILMGALYDDSNSSDSGAAYLFYGSGL